jgi:hypothetical protein
MSYEGQAGRQASRQAGRQASRQAGRQAGIRVCQGAYRYVRGHMMGIPPLV